MKTFLFAGAVLSVALSLGIGGPAGAAVQEEPPYTFFFTRYEMLGDPNNPEGVRYHSDGEPFAQTPGGSKVALSGRGGWNPGKETAEGGGRYTIEDSSGRVTARGSWRATDFVAFEQFDGWWGMGPEFEERGWQGPAGSPSFSGFLTLDVNLEGRGEGTLVAWCLMPEVLERHPHLANPDGHVSDGISLTGGNLDFTEFREGEMAGPPYQGVMFYSTDPAADGYVLTSAGNTVRKTASDGTSATATISAGASPAASPTALADTGGAPAVLAVALTALLASMALGLAALWHVLRRNAS